MKYNLKGLITILLVVILLFNVTGIVKAETTTDKNTIDYPYTIFAESDENGAITINADNFCINGNIATNGTIVSSGNMNINGSKKENVNENVIYIFDKIESQYFTNCKIEKYTDDYMVKDQNIDINTPVEVKGDITLSGNVNINAPIKAYRDISLQGEVKNSNDSIIYSKYGDIVIDSLNVNLNGLIYAPFGNVEIKAQNLNLNNIVIIANSITFECSSINANYNKKIANFVGVNSENFVIPYEDYIYFLKSRSDLYDNTECGDIDVDKFIQLSDDISEYANVDIEYDGMQVKKYITDLDEIYGDSITSLTGFSYEEIAKKVLSMQYGVDKGQVVLGKSINLLDANNINTYKGFNYVIEGNKGYITVATHSKETLIKDVVEGEILPEKYGDLYYLSSGELYYKNIDYYTLDGVCIDKDEFSEFLRERKEQYYNLTLNLLADLETECVYQLNNLIYVDNYNYDDMLLQKRYDGQSGSGYGGIDNCAKYLKDRYGGTITKTSSKSLTMATFSQSSLDNGSNCSLAAITRVLYYYNKNGYTKISNDYKTIYSKVKKIAKKYGYTSRDGISATKINNVVNDVLKDYGYSKSNCKGIYVWNFKNQVKKEIDNNRPVIMNIARGYYGNHTVTVCGYAIYKRSSKKSKISSNKTYNMIQVYDGWTTYKRFIDYSAFAYDLRTSGFGSFNTVTMKK